MLVVLIWHPSYNDKGVVSECHVHGLKLCDCPLAEYLIAMLLCYAGTAVSSTHLKEIFNRSSRRNVSLYSSRLNSTFSRQANEDDSAKDAAAFANVDMLADFAGPEAEVQLIQRPGPGNLRKTQQQEFIVPSVPCSRKPNRSST